MVLGSFAGLQSLSAPATPPPAVIYTEHIKLFVRKTCLIFSRLWISEIISTETNSKITQRKQQQKYKNQESSQFETRNPLCQWNIESTAIQTDLGLSRLFQEQGGGGGYSFFSWGEQTIIRIYFDCFEEPFHSFYSRILYSPVKTLKGWVKVR